MSRWLIGLVVLAMVVGTLTFIGLSILQIKFALFLAIIAGLLEFLPYLGPIMATVPAAIIAFSQEPIKALIVIGMYILIQWLENYLLVPQIMRKTVGLNSVVIIIVVLIGAKLAGLLGLILAVPVAAVLAEIIKDMKAANN